VSVLLQAVDARERAILERCAALPRAFVRAMSAVTRLGNGWLWLLALAAAGPIGRDALLRVLLSAALANLFIALGKEFFRRPRPASLAAEIAGSPLSFDRFSFPSGHATNAFAWAGVVATLVPGATSFLLIVAAAIGVSRVALRVHYPSDVVVGALAGWAFAHAAARCLP
jgi:undecaprenyl-diphosphatase